MPDIAWVNGKFSRLEDACISINDRGFLFGDSIYETLSILDGTPILLEEHLARLADSCKTLRFRISNEFETIREVLAEGVEQSGYKNATVYIQLTRGIETRSHVLNLDLQPTLILTFREHPQIPENYRTAGVKAQTHPDIRLGYRHLKTTNLLGNIFAKSDARENGCFEAILHQDRIVTEACSSSVFLVKNGAVITGPLDLEILPGVTREFIVRALLPEFDFPFREERYSVSELKTADEVFIAATSYVILPIVQIDEQTIGDGIPGPITTALMQTGLQKISEMQRRT